MPSQALTPAFLETLPSLKPEARGTYYFDTEITGFAVEHRANGRATYYYRYRDAGKRVRLARIGAVDKISLIEARVLASRMKKMVAEGGDPKLEADRFKDIPTFAEFAAEHYMPHAKTRKRSWTSDDSLLRNHILPVLGTHRLSRIRRSDIVVLHNGMKQSGYAAATANRVLVLISFMFNCAMRWELMPMVPNPANGIEHFPDNGARERYLSQEEAQRLMAVERQPLCPRATTILAGFQAAEVGVLFGFSG